MQPSPPIRAWFVLFASAPAATAVNVRAIVQRPDGSLLVGGDFDVAGGLTSPSLATTEPPCSATASPYDAGCLGVIGLAPIAIPLSVLLPEGQPGCSFLATLDILMVATNGPGNTASTSFVSSNDPALISVPFHQQTLPLGFDASGALAAVIGAL